MKKFSGYILSPFAIIASLLALVIFQPIQWLCYTFFGYKAHKYVADVLHFLLICSAGLLGNKLIFINKQNLPKGRPMIFLANHQSVFDISPISWFLRKYHAKFISKIELTKNIPSISYYLRIGGGANIDRNNPRQSLIEIAALGTRMEQNKWSAIIFPEGTRSSDGTVKAFQSAGIVTLLKKCPDALLVPIAVKNSWKIVQYGVYPLGTFERITFEVLDPIEPYGIAADELVKQAEQQIRKKLTEIGSPLIA